MPGRVPRWRRRRLRRLHGELRASSGKAYGVKSRLPRAVLVTRRPVWAADLAHLRGARLLAAASRRLPIASVRTRSRSATGREALTTSQSVPSATRVAAPARAEERWRFEASSPAKARA